MTSPSWQGKHGRRQQAASMEAEAGSWELWSSSRKHQAENVNRKLLQVLTLKAHPSKLPPAKSHILPKPLHTVFKRLNFERHSHLRHYRHKPGSGNSIFNLRTCPNVFHTACPILTSLPGPSKASSVTKSLLTFLFFFLMIAIQMCVKWPLVMVDLCLFDD